MIIREKLRLQRKLINEKLKYIQRDVRCVMINDLEINYSDQHLLEDCLSADSLWKKRVDLVGNWRSSQATNKPYHMGRIDDKSK